MVDCEAEMGYGVFDGKVVGCQFVVLEFAGVEVECKFEQTGLVF
jgi:hypothetical protein